MLAQDVPFFEAPFFDQKINFGVSFFVKIASSHKFWGVILKK